MSKRLVKTAKQQFEERLRGMQEYGFYKADTDDVFHGCEDHDGKFVILRENGGYYFECKYAQNYWDLIESEDFLNAMAERFLEQRVSVKKLFDWYASADRDNPPFNLVDIWRVGDEETFKQFEDIYEEVPDARVITAKEQWEKEIGNDEKVFGVSGTEYAVQITDGSITFFVSQNNEYFKEIYPSFDELRKDAKFVVRYLDSVRRNHDADMEAAMEWLNGGEYTMSDVSLLDIYECADCIDHLCYHDKEESAEVDKHDFSAEMEGLRKKMVAHVEELCEKGMTVDAEILCQNPFLLWLGKCYTPTDDIIDCLTIKDEKGKWKFCYDYRAEGEHECGFDEFSVEGLYQVIEAMK